MNESQVVLLVIFAFLGGGAFREFVGDLRPLVKPLNQEEE